MRRLALKIFAASLALALAMPVLAADNYKIMIGGHPGGGYDQVARGIGKALQEAGVAGSVTYENKSGAGGTIGLAEFVNASKGDPYALTVVGALMVSAIVQNNPPIKLSNATPVARLVAEYVVLVVPANSPLKTMHDVVEQMKKDPASVKWGGGSKGSVDHLSVAMIARDVDVDVDKVNYVPFRGAGATTAAVLGGLVTVGVCGWAEAQEFVAGGKMRAVAITSPVRLKGVNVPTLKEQGIDVEIYNWRGIYGAPGITREQRKALADAVLKASRTKSWSETLERNSWLAIPLTGPSFDRFVNDEHARLHALMSKLGIL